jgi:hypothetical protein
VTIAPPSAAGSIAPVATPSGWVPRVRRDSFLPLPAPPATLGQSNEVRSTLLATSLQSIRKHGLFDLYSRHLAGPFRETVLTAVAGAWLPINAAKAHYLACEALRLEPAMQLALGMEVGDRVNGTFLGFMVRTAKTVGVTPWLALAQSAKLYFRLFQGGGGIAIGELGPKEARIELVGNPLFEIDYFRNGCRGFYQAATRLFCTRVYTHDLSRGRSTTGMTLRLSWA